MKLSCAIRYLLLTVPLQVAYAAGHYASGNLWLLLQSLLIDLEPPPQMVTDIAGDSALPRSVSAPSAMPPHKRSPLRDAQTRSSSSDPPNPAQKSSPGMLSRKISRLDGSVASPLSPRHLSIVPTTPRPHVTQNDANSHISSAQVTPQKRDTSRSTSFSAEKSSSSSSRRRRQIGEGALADSDDESDPGSRHLSVDQGSRASNTGADVFTSHGTPSTTSRVQPRRFVSSPGVLEDIDDWAEDEKDDDSASPASSADSDSADSVASTRAARSSSLKRKARSQSSAKPSTPLNTSHASTNITRTDSQSSVLTVTGGADHPAVKETVTIADNASMAPSTRSKSQNRLSTVHSLSGVIKAETEYDGYFVPEEDVKFLEWNHEVIKQREEDYREASWKALKLMLEEMADQASRVFLFQKPLHSKRNSGRNTNVRYALVYRSRGIGH